MLNEQSCRQSMKNRNLQFALFEYIIQSIQVSCEILCREPIKINDNRQNLDFIGGTLNYVTYVMS